jgi:hypothetical protein
MKKPIHGDEISIRYLGNTVKAVCNDVTELSAGGVGLARFTIISRTPFRRGTEAHLLTGPNELHLNVDRVTTMPHKGLNIVSFTGIFDTPSTPSRATAGR